MRRLKRSLPLAAAVVLLGLATVFALVAVDARAWQSTFARDDVRFRAHHSQSQVWSSPAILPGDPARAILGLGDSLAYRQALQNFWLNVVGIERAKGTDLAVTRLAAQTQLQQLANTASTTAERSSAANLLGVMTITTSASDDATLAQIYERATSYFQLAIQEDPANWAAKVNLELTLRLKRPAKSHFGADARGGFGQGGSEGNRAYRRRLLTGITFLTPLAALFALAAAVPLAAFVLMERRTRVLRQLFSLAAPSRRDHLVVAGAVALIPALVAVAVAQPVVIRRQSVTQRADAQAFIVLDTSLSMTARTSPTAPSRFQLAEQDVLALLPRFGDIPVGLATMTDRVLPNVMPTTNDALLRETLAQSVAINEPPPSRLYPGIATSYQRALLPIPKSHLFPPGIKHPILIIFTDGESPPLPAGYGADLARLLTIPPLFVQVWAPNEHIYVNGEIDPRYHEDPHSTAVLNQFANDTHGSVFSPTDLNALVQKIRDEAGPVRRETTILGYVRVALGPWFLLGGVVPLGFLFWRRNL